MNFYLAIKYNARYQSEVSHKGHMTECQGPI